MLHHRIAKYIDHKALFYQKDKLLIALSGGADSVALLRILLQLGYTCEAAHCNFHLRGEESCRDEEFVKGLCWELNVPLHCIDFDTVGYAEIHKLSIEMAARELRYHWFEELRKETECNYIAVAHHRDDSVETLLLNLIRGTGINGLCGIRPKNEKIVRPLLEVSRAEILNYLEILGQAYMTDRTNLQDEYTRNKIRLNLLPMMEQINPSVKESIAATASRLVDVATIYKVEMNEACNRISPDGRTVLIDTLLAEVAPKAVLYEFLSPFGFNASQVDNIFLSLTGQPGKVFLVPGWRLVKDRISLLLSPENEMPQFPIYPMTLPEVGIFNYEGCTFEIKRMAYTKDFVIPRDQSVACLDAEKLSFPLTIRRWKKGDVFVPFGMKGKKLVSDYLTDRKYALQKKERALVVCSDDKIVWLVGERSDDRFRINDSTGQILLLYKINAQE